MQSRRYLPAHKVKAGSLRLGRVSVRTRDDQELGKLTGFIIEPRAPRIRSLVLEAENGQFELAMRPLQFDPRSRSLRILHEDFSAASRSRFVPESVPEIQEDDLWVPFYNSAA